MSANIIAATSSLKLGVCADDKSILIDRQRHDYELNKEDDRLRSFLNTSYSGVMDAEKLARSGFYHNKNNNVICYFCKVEINADEWEDVADDDDIIAKHLTKAPQCPLLAGCETNNIPSDIELLNNMLPTRSVSQDECGHGRPHKHNSRNNHFYEYPFYKCYDQRVHSFEDWPYALSQKKEHMASAGFFYTGISDKVICFSCGLKLKKWEPTDVPFIEHAKYLDKCEFMENLTGIKYINSIKQNMDTENYTIPVEATKNNNNNADDDDNEKVLNIDIRCAICLSDSAIICFLPCYHCACCYKCSLSINDSCPICRCPILSKQKIFFP